MPLALAGCELDQGSALNRQLDQARADEVRAYAVSRAADRFAAEQRLRALHAFNPQQLAIGSADER